MKKKRMYVFLFSLGLSLGFSSGPGDKVSGAAHAAASSVQAAAALPAFTPAAATLSASSTLAAAIPSAATGRVAITLPAVATSPAAAGTASTLAAGSSVVAASVITSSPVFALAAAGAATYRNPVVPYSLPDPSVIRADDGYFYLYATEDIRNLPIHRSKDLVHWEQVATAFTDDSRPDFEPGAGIWAPDINRIGDRYVLYYSLSVWGGEWTCGIGCATSDCPKGPFKDEGMMLRSNQIGVQNSIDPFYIEEGGKKYLFWGSFRGIYGVRLTDDGLRVAEGEKPRRIAGTAYEGTYIHKRGGYYYLFASTGTCCEGLKSTYTTVVGRSKSLFGPYVDKAGRPMLDNHHEILVGKNAAFVGTGHNSEIVTDEAGRDWFFYHAVDTERPEGRVLMLDRVDWVEGWPSVAGRTPSLEAEAPVFGE